MQYLCSVGQLGLSRPRFPLKEGKDYRGERCLSTPNAGLSVTTKSANGFLIVARPLGGQGPWHRRFGRGRTLAAQVSRPYHQTGRQRHRAKELRRSVLLSQGCSEFLGQQLRWVFQSLDIGSSDLR